MQLFRLNLCEKVFENITINDIFYLGRHKKTSSVNILQSYASKRVRRGEVRNGNNSFFINIPILDKNAPTKMLS